MERRTPVCDPLVVLTLPGLDASALELLPALHALAAEAIPLGPSVPGIGPVVRASLTTGAPPSVHGVVSYRGVPPLGFPLPRDTRCRVPRVWDQVQRAIPLAQCAVWNGDPPWCRTATHYAWLDWAAVPAHGASGSEVPLRLQSNGAQREAARIPMSDLGWHQLLHALTQSLLELVEHQRPELVVFHMPGPVHAMEQSGPASDAAQRCWRTLDRAAARLVDGLGRAYGGRLLWLVASEQVVVPVRTMVFPNRVLHAAGHLVVQHTEQGPVPRLADSSAWAWTDSQVAHIYVHDASPASLRRLAALWHDCDGIRQVLCGPQRGAYDLDHPHCGDVLLVAEDDVFLSGDYWPEDGPAPRMAHRLAAQVVPGYDPLAWWPSAAAAVSGQVRRVHGACGAPPRRPWQRGVLLASEHGVLPGPLVADIDLTGLVLHQLGV
jgi:hypothetical protein